MSTPSQPRFQTKAKVITAIGFLLTLSNVVFWDPNRNFILNTLIVASSMLTGFVVFYAFYKRINVAKYAIYFLALVMIFGGLLLGVTKLPQQIVLVANMVVYMGIILVLSIYRDEAREYFRTQGLRMGWKIAYGFMVILVCGLTAAGLAFQSRLKAQKQMITGEIQDDIIMDGTPDPNVMEACKLQYANQGLSDAQMDMFCKCATLNLARVTGSLSPEEMNPTALMAKALAVADVCMKKTVPTSEIESE